MRRLIILVILFVCYPAFAQKQDTTQFNKYALLFEVSDWLDFNSFNGANLAFKRHLTEDQALRLTLSANRLNRDRDDFKEITSADSIAQNGINKDKQKSIEIALDYIFYLKIKNDIRFYYGPGVFVGYQTSSYKSDYELENNSIEYFRKRETDEISFGLSIILGTEWLVKNNIGLFIEYSNDFYYSNIDREDRRTYKPDNNLQNYFSKGKSDEWGFRGSSVDLGIAIYF